MFENYETKFQLESGTWVFPPTTSCKAHGKTLCRQLQKSWTIPAYYFHLKKGGHVAALREHVSNSHFCVVDISQFFSSTTKSMVLKALKSVGQKYTEAKDHAFRSTVKNPDGGKNFVLPYGFVQSALLATICLEKSYLGQFFRQMITSPLRLSIYMDDIIISGSIAEVHAVSAAFQGLLDALDKSPYSANIKKTQEPSAKIEVFNTELSHDLIRITPHRMQKFTEAVNSNPNPFSVDAILRYVGALNQQQGLELEKNQLGTSQQILL